MSAAEESARIDLLGIVVPMLDEIERIDDCLDALAGSVSAIRATDAVRVRMVVVDDGSTDGSAVRAATREGVEVVSSGARRVGIARSRGVDEILRGEDPARVWLAMTDADSRVPVGWAAHHLEVAAGGAGALLGAIRPDARELTSDQFDAWLRIDRPRPDHDHVHGANLGVRADHYVRVGGFAAVDFDEDVDLVRRLREAGVVVRATDTAPVVTSARRFGRAPRGFSSFVQALTGPRESLTT